jgi:predicted alpha-1,6-mannanase (GH76 family)
LRQLGENAPLIGLLNRFSPHDEGVTDQGGDEGGEQGGVRVGAGSADDRAEPGVEPGVEAGVEHRAHIGLWAARAGVTERAVHARHLRRLWGLPGTLLGVVGWPAGRGQRLFGQWDYWWQAHVLDCLVDAHQRLPSAARRRTIDQFVRGLYLRNLRHWTNDFYDDIAWLGLALLRAEREVRLHRPEAVKEIATRLRQGWTDHSGGGLWWRVGSDYKNVPANGPAAILLARLSDPELTKTGGPGERIDRQRARSTVEWMEENLLDPATGLLWDGLHVSPEGDVRGVEKTTYTYCQGVYLGACVELATRSTVRGASAWADRAVRTIEAVAAGVTVVDEDKARVLRGQGGGDGGLFAGILARYLALAAVALPPLGAPYRPAAQVAAELVFASAESAWRHRAIAPGGPLFGADWAIPTVSPARSRGPQGRAARDLSVQTGAWMLLEAAAAMERAGVNRPPKALSAV